MMLYVWKILAVPLFILFFASGSAAASEWIQTSGPAGGNIEAVAQAPDKTLYAGGRAGTLFKSTDGGENWSSLAVIDLSTIIHQIHVLKSDPQTIYVNTGSLYRSTNGENAFVRIDAIDGGVNRFAVSPLNEQVIAAASPDGNVYVTENGFADVMARRGDWPEGATVETASFDPDGALWVGAGVRGEGRLYRSTDNGASWEEITLSQRADDADIGSIHADPSNPHIVYVGLRDVNNEPFVAAADDYLLKTTDGGGSWTSLHVPTTDSAVTILGVAEGALVVGSGSELYTSADGGQTWTDISPPERQIDGSASFVMDGSTFLTSAPFGTGVLKSSDSGASWKILTNGLTNVSISLLAAPAGQVSGTLYATSVNGEGTFRTTDKGKNWQNVVFNGITHRWADELQTNPHNSAEVWQVADVGEIFRTRDKGDSWQKIINPYGAGFRYGSIYAMASAPADRARLYSLRSGFGLYRSDDSGESWSFLHNSEIDYSYTIAVHPTDKNIVYSGFIPKPFQNFAMVRKSADGGGNWETALTIPDSTGITSVGIDPLNASTVYAGSAGRGGSIWKSTDSGAQWQQPNAHFTFTNVHTLSADPVNPDVAYAGTWGGGTWKTADGGKNWTRLLNDPTTSAAAILVHPTDGRIIYIADRTSPKIYRTMNGGADWEVWFDAGPGYYRILSAELSLANPDIVYASVFLKGGPMQGDLFKIVEGVSSRMTGSLPRLPVSVTAHPQNSDIVYAVVHMEGVYKSVDGGSNWSEVVGSWPAGMGFNDLVIDSRKPDTVYLIGGNDVDENLSHRGVDPALMHTVYKSTDGGASWKNCNDDHDGHFGTNSGDIKGFAISPLDSDLLFAAAANGVLRSADGGVSWSGVDAGLNYAHMAGVSFSADGSKLYCPTLGGGVHTAAATPESVVWDDKSALIADIHHVMVKADPATAGTVYASAYPGGMFKSADGGQTWRECNFGLASFAIEDPKRQGYYAFAIAESNPQILYLALYGVGVYKSFDGAATWMPVNGADQIMRGALLTDILIDPADAGKVIVGTENGVFRSFDGGASWTAMNDGLDCTDVRTLSWAEEGRIYAGTRGYEVYLFEGSQWRQLPGFGQYGTFWPIWDNRPLYQYTSLLFHPTDPDTLYIGTFPAGIYKSVDGGSSWREKNVGWLNDGVFSLVFKPGDPNVIYAGTYNGLSLSEDNGEHWRKWSEGWPAEQWVFSIDFDPRNPAVVYACSKNGENEGRGRDDFHGTVMKSVNGGATWFPITSGLDLNSEFYKIIVDRRFPDTLYLASQHDGVFVSRNGGAIWAPFNEGLTNTMPGTNGNNVTNTMLLSPDGNDLYFGSNGSGVYSRQLYDDTDEDGLADGWEMLHMESLTASDGTGDADDDNLTDAQEYMFLSNPKEGDTDGDGLPDPWEALYRLNPLIDDSAADTDRDGYNNLQEFRAGTSPVDAFDKPQPAYAETKEATLGPLVSATLNGIVNPRGFSTSCRFEYGTTTAYGNSTAAADAGKGLENVEVSVALTDLEPDTRYHYRLTADTGFDISHGDDKTFIWPLLKGDLDLSGKVDLTDALIGLRVLSGGTQTLRALPGNCIDGEGKLDLSEVLYIMQDISDMR